MTDAEKALHKGLMKILGDGTYPLKAKEVTAFISVYKWAGNLPARFEELKKKEEK